MASRKTTIRVARNGASIFSVTFSHSPITIGSSAENDLELDDPAVRPKHALVRLSEKGLTYSSLGSSPSFIQGEPISEKTLAPNEIVSVPPFDLCFADQRVQPAEVTKAQPSAAGAEGTAFLEVVAGPAELAGRRFSLTSRDYRIGRAEGSGIRLEAQTISRSHALLTRGATGLWELEDLGSGNGTFVNDARVGKVSLAPGDRVLLGKDTLLVFDVTRDAPELSSPTKISASGFLFVERNKSPEGVVLEIEGRIDEYNFLAFRKRLDDVIGAGYQVVTLDLSRPTSMDYRGLGALVHAGTALGERGAELRISGLNEELEDLFTESGLDLYFEGRMTVARRPGWGLEPPAPQRG